MITKLPEWYKLLNLASNNEEVLEKRSKTIIKIVKKKDIKLLLNCVKLYLNRSEPSPEFPTELMNLFLEDPMFPQSNNDLELKILAGAIIAECIETSKTDERIQVALALRAGLFQLPASRLINVDIIKIVDDFLQKESIQKRTLSNNPTVPEFNFQVALPTADVATIVAQLGKINEKLNAASASVKEVLNFSKNNIAILQEESNVHWWIFRGWSNLLKMQLASVDSRTIPLIVGKELGDLTSVLPGSFNSEQFLKKMISDNIKDAKGPISLKEQINGIDKSVQLLFKIDASNPVSDLCPLHLAISTALQFDDKDSWTVIFEKASSIKSSTEIEPLDIAIQCYNESVLQKAFK